MDSDDRLIQLLQIGGLSTVATASQDTADRDGEVQRVCVAIARRLRAVRTIGLLPAADNVATVPIGIHLGLALAQLTGAPVGFVDANPRWPALAGLSDLAPRQATGKQTALPAKRDEGAFKTRWLHGHLALLIPQGAAEAGAGVPRLAQALREGQDIFAHVLVDLTGFVTLGEHMTAIDLCDGVAVIGRVAETLEQDLLERSREIPPERNLGVILTGGRA